MGRVRRSEQQEGWHHVVNRGVARERTFWSDADRVEFGRVLGVASERSAVEVHAYCLMPNHYHLVLHCPQGGLSEFVQYFASVYTRHVNDRIGRDGPIFRGRFRSRQIGGDTYLLAAVRYVHRNPLPLLATDSVESYRWSSHRTYLGLRRTPAWMHTDVVLGLFGGDLEGFHRFVTGRAGEPDPNHDDRRVEEAVWLAVEEFGDIGRAPQGLVRTVVNLVRDRLAPGSTSPALRRARRQASADPTLEEMVQRALSLLPPSRTSCV